MQEYQRQFIEFSLERKALRFGDFTLKSGRQSPYFFNAGELFKRGADLAQLGRFYADALVNAKVDYDLLFGPAYKGIPVASATAIALYHHYQQDVPYCFNRKETKDHGEGGHLVGAELKGRVMLVDDVITAGTAIRESMQLVEQQGAILTGVLVALDRQERGQGKLSAIGEIQRDYGAKVYTIITLSDLIVYLAEQGQQELLVKMQSYRAEYGISA